MVKEKLKVKKEVKKMFSSKNNIGFKARNISGQYTIVALVMTFIMLIMFAKFYPTIKTYIDELLPQVDELTGTVIALIPFMIAIGILMSVVWYIIPKR